jgi:tetratricopeptide (TPR) repeat protein
MIGPVIANVRRRQALPLACLLLAACAARPGLNAPDPAQTATAPDEAAPGLAARVGREKAIASYRDYLARYPGGPEHNRITRRLADLLVEQAADLQLAAATSGDDAAQLEAAARQSYDEAISRYEYLLHRFPDGADTTELLYQLSRAYGESGASQQALTAIDRLLVRVPQINARLYADTRFRRGELLFGEGAYRAAGQSYQAVVDLGAAVPAYEQALYKLGWSLFKQERYTDALPVLFAFLDLKLSPDGTLKAQLPRLSPADQEQLTDVFRVISMSFSQLGGVDAVEAFFSGHGSRSYEDPVYLELAGFYVEQDQVNEAAGTWRALALRDPLGPEAPRLTARAINLYRQAGFQQRVVETETLFVHDYGMGSDYWTVHSPADFPDVLLVLQSSLQALARVAHEQARTSRAGSDYRMAEHWYREYLAAFGEESEAAEINFQLAELLYENGEYRQAMDEYERTAWSRGAYPRADDAALGALRASEKILQQDNVADRAAVSERAAAGALRFVMTWPVHPAAPVLLAQTGTALLEQQQFGTALDLGERVQGEVAALPPALRQVAWSIKAQAQYGLGDYPEAAAAYREALQLAGEGDPRRAALQEGLALAVFKQAVQTAMQGDNRAAVVLYQQAAQHAPDASLRSKAQYDAATALLAQQSWTEAVGMLAQFRRDYPGNPLQGEVTRKLAYAHDRNGQSGEAAAEYLRLGQDRQQSEALQREALLRAAELSAQTGAVRQAISTRELYLKRFPQPAAAAIDVMQQLADLEADSGHAGKRRDWLEEIIRLDRVAGTAGTRVPAAAAALELAENRLADFRQIQLVNPVQGSLAHKLQAMKQALQAFEAAINYGVTPVTTAATYQIASMYDALGQALLTSERPASLTAAELAEYEVLLTEQAEPFAQQAIDIYTTNAQRTGGEQRDPWVEKSVQRLGELQRGP